MSDLRNAIGWLRYLIPPASFKCSLCCFVGLAALLFLLPFSASTQSVDRAQLLQDIFNLQIQILNTTDPTQIATLREQLNQKETLFLAPAPEDYAAFANFLKQPDTGLARIMPRGQFPGNLLSTLGGGAYYYFIQQINAYGHGSDLELEQGQFSVGFAGADFGFLVALGDVSLENVTLQHPGVKYLAEFVPPNAESEARADYQLSQSGFNANGFNYRQHQSALLNTTYVVRSVQYQASDDLVAFRPVRQDTDGSLILVWKLLKWFPTPQLNGTNLATVSAATYGRSAFASEAIATAFAPNIASTTALATDLPLPPSLGGVSVTVFDSKGKGRFAPLFAVTNNQVNYQIPPGTATGPAQIYVNRQGGVHFVENIRIAAVAPGLFTANSDGQGVPAAVAFRRRGSVETYESVARFDSGQNKFVTTPIDLGPDLGSSSDQVALLLFGTGIRLRSDLSAVSAKIGGVDVPVLYAGAQGAPGLDQVNVLLPRGLVGRGEVDLVLTVDGQTANTVRVNIK